MDWVKRHKVLTAFFVIIGLGVVGAASGGGNTAQPANNGEQTQQATEQPKPEEKKFDLKAFYDQVQNGQTKEQVIQLAGKDPDNCSENEIAGYGKTEVCNWNGSFSDGAVVSISFKDNAVNMKNKTGF